MTSIFDLLKQLAGPLIKLSVGLFPVVGVLIATVADPAGAANQFLVTMIDHVAIYWPETPENLKLANLIMGQLEPGTSVGKSILIDIYQTGFLMLSVVLLIKLYKLIPFKAT